MRRALPLILSVAILLAGCKIGAAPLPPKVTPFEKGEFVAPIPSLLPVTVDTEMAGKGLPAIAERMIIRRADLSLVVQDTKEAISRIEAIAVEKGGYLHQSSVWKENENLKAQLTIMVPATKFEETLDALRKLAVDILSESVSGQDVTEEYTDLEARLKNLEATEKELRELLATVRERTGKAEDIMAVYRELTHIREEIERVKGRMKYLEQMTSFSTITIYLTPSVLAQPVAPATWKPARTFWYATRALVRALQFTVDAAIWVTVVVIPLSLPFALAAFLFWRNLRKPRPKQGVSP
ncbi:MAG: DUF4349 domain-containing protein [Anaerolineae bacterium]|nr:DUF4349 domain-containing protein [Anaerolineae bacterium]MDW8101528.1 DUF4349 domain-containing protein [Anaerolineae bacterium]